MLPQHLLIVPAAQPIFHSRVLQLKPKRFWRLLLSFFSLLSPLDSSSSGHLLRPHVALLGAQSQAQQSLEGDPLAARMQRPVAQAQGEDRHEDDVYQDEAHVLAGDGVRRHSQSCAAHHRRRRRRRWLRIGTQQQIHSNFPKMNLPPHRCLLQPYRHYHAWPDDVMESVGKWSHRCTLRSVRAVSAGALERRLPACRDAFVGWGHALWCLALSREVHLERRPRRRDPLVLDQAQEVKELLEVLCASAYEAHSFHVGGPIHHILHTVLCL